MAAAIDGSPAVALVHGESGVGKTSLVHRVVDAHDALQVLVATGDVAEIDVAWGYIDQLARGMGPDAVGELSSMVSLAETSAVGAWLLGRLGDLEQEGPVALTLGGYAVLFVVSALLVLHWSRRAGWGAAQRLALATGALVPHVGFAILQMPLVDVHTAVAVLGDIVFTGALVAFLVVGWRRVGSAP